MNSTTQPQENLHTITTTQSLRELIPLQPRKIIKKCLWGIIGIVMAWSVGSFFIMDIVHRKNSMPTTSFWDSGSALWVAWVAFLIALLLWRTGFQILYFLTYYYDLDPNNLVIRKGVISKREINLPFNKITDVYVDQDFMDVMFGLYDVHISTPTVESGIFSHIDGVNKEGAAEIKRIILEKINEAKE